MVELNRLFAADQSNTDMHAPAHALEFFERATELDDEFALAWAARARSLAIMTMMEQVAPAQGWPQVQGFVNTALELAPDLAEVQIAAGQNSRGAEALSHYDRAIEINPNHAQAHVERAAVLRRVGRYREAFDANAKALELDPRSGWAVESALYASFYQGDLENFDRRIEEMQRLWPAANGLVAEAHLRMETGQLERFAELQLRANDIPDIGVLDWYASAPRHFGDSYLALGLEEHARGWLVAPGMKARYDDVIDLYNGDFDAAIAFLSPEIVKSRDRPRYAYRWYPEVIASLVESYLYARRYEELASLLTELDWKPGLYPLPDGTVPAPPWPEVAYAYALFETGQTDLGHEWLDNLVAELEHRLEEGIRMPNHFYELARLRGMQGRTDDALAALQTAIDLGWRRWYFDRDPVLDPIRTHPQYADLKAAYDADIARMRASVLRDLAAAASGDNDVVKLR